jgi:alkylhydroperoxidase family enzyme
MCVDVHKNIAKMLGMKEEQVEETLKGIEAINCDEKEKVLLRLALKAAAKDNYKTMQEDIDAVKDAGWSELEILEAVRVAAYFNYINTLSNVFGLGKK